MKNLNLFRKRSIRTPNSSCLLKDGDGSFILILDSLELMHYDRNLNEVAQVKSPTIDVPPTAKVLNASLHPIDESIILAFDTGELVSYQKLEGLSYNGELVGSFSSGIKAFSTSPDHELVSLVNGDGQLIMMLRSSLTVLSEVILEEVVKVFVNNNVSVGWGRKETQFHGSVGKQAALAKNTTRERLLVGDDRLPRLSWRQDGQYFSCSFITSNQEGEYHRQIAIFNREGQLVAVKEPTEGLGQAIGWRQDGSLIAASQKWVDNTNKVIFFERNGLSHGEFLINNKDLNIQELQWNCNGSILAITMSNGQVDFWTSSNYHWYLKYSLSPLLKGGGDGGGHPPSFPTIIWDFDDPMSLSYIEPEAGEIFRYEFVTRIDRSNCTFDDDLCIVAVVDGNNILLSPFSKANIPPPMSLGHVNVGFVANCLAVFSEKGLACLAATSPTGIFACYKLEFINNQLVSTLVSSSSTMTGPSFKQLLFRDHLHPFGLLENDTVVFFEQGQIFKFEGIDDEPIATMSCRFGSLFLHTYSGDIIKSNIKKGLERIKGSQETACHWTDSIICKDKIKGVLHCRNNRLVLSDSDFSVDGCTSFIVHPEFLCFTNSEGLVKFYPLERDPDEWLSLKSDGGEELCRLSEDGATCVAVVPKAASLVLLLPRGNLEIIYPRAFVLSQVRHLLNSLSYREAFLLCRRHRVDLNIIHDNNPELFISTIQKFVQEIPETDYLNLFMSSLNPENVTITRYGAFMINVGKKADLANWNKNPIDDGKINSTCDKLREILLSLNPVKYAECIMTAYVCRRPPNLEASLQAILKLSEVADNAVEKALKYLIFLVPAEKLYRVALEMYNLPLALSIARRSQMDPSEYTEFLSELHKCGSPDYQRYSIDNFLQRYGIALEHLIKSERPFEECLEYISRHSLYSVAFKIYRVRDRTLWRKICQVYAQHLVEKEGSLKEAVDLFQFSGNQEQACSLAIRSGYWQKVILLSKEWEAVDNVKSVVEVLLEQKKFVEALSVAKSYCSKDPSFIIKTALAGNFWTEASRVCHLNGISRDGICLTASTCKGEVLSELQELIESFSQKVSRLEFLQGQLVSSLDVEKIRKELEMTNGTADGMTDGITDISDGISEVSFRTAASFAGSQISQLSRATSSKSKKKADRQRMRGKPGSPFERDYLREAIKELIQRTGSLYNFTLDLVEFFVGEELFEEAKNLQDSFIAASAAVKSSCEKLQRLVSIQEERMTMEVLTSLGLTPWSIPSTLQVDHSWKTAFELPPEYCSKGRIEYLL